MQCTAILLPSGTVEAPNQPFVFDARIGNPSYHSENILSQPCALNCELWRGCKVVSSTRLLLFTRLPSPRLHSTSPRFKETLTGKEAASQAFYDFIGPGEALLGRCWTVIEVLDALVSALGLLGCMSYSS